MRYLSRMIRPDAVPPAEYRTRRHDLQYAARNEPWNVPPQSAQSIRCAALRHAATWQLVEQNRVVARRISEIGRRQ